MKILLHTCCAPCSGAIIETLLKENTPPTIFYCNPNIYPYDEYLIRKNECSRFAKENGLEIVDDDYRSEQIWKADHENWKATCTVGHENDPERGPRCLECFKFRLLRAARYAITQGYDTLTTTLASSRWKSLDQINEAGKWAVETAILECRNSSAQPPTLTWLDRNWRKGGLQERRGQIIKERGFYNQLYCGCEFSMERLTQTSSKCTPCLRGEADGLPRMEQE